MRYVSPTVPTKLEQQGSEVNYGKPGNFYRLGFLTIPRDVIKNLSGGNKTQVEEGYDLVTSGISVFNNAFLSAPAFQEFKDKSKQLQAKILERSNSLGELRESVRNYCKAVPEFNASNAYLQLCDYYQRSELWTTYEQTINKKRNLSLTEKELRVTKLKFLQEQWQEQVAYAHYTNEQLVDLLTHSETFETCLNDLLSRESYFNAEAKFFFDDVKAVQKELKRQQKAIVLAAYHRIRIANKYTNPSFSDPLIELRKELFDLGITEIPRLPGIKESDLDISKARNGLDKTLTSGQSVKSVLTTAVNKYGTTELRARLTGLGTYQAYSADFAIPVSQYEENIFPLPGVFPATHLSINTRLDEFNLDNNDLIARHNKKGWWNRWERCRYKLFSHPDFRLYNACSEVVRGKAFTEPNANQFLLAINVPANDRAALLKVLTDKNKAEGWIKDNAKRLLDLLDPETAGSPVPNSWASLSWIKGTESHSTNKVIESYRRILAKAKQGSLQYPVPIGLEKYIPFEAKEPGSFQRTRHDLFLGTTFLAEFNKLASEIKDGFDADYLELTANNGIDRLQYCESKLRLKKIADIDAIVTNLEKEITNSMPSSFNPLNWFSSEASKTKQMLREWQNKLNETKRDITDKKSKIASFIADSVNKYIDETSAKQIDVVLLKRLGDFVDQYGNIYSNDNKIKFVKATTIGGILEKYINDDYFVRPTANAPKRFVSINLEKVFRITEIAKQLGYGNYLDEKLNENEIVKRKSALERIIKIVQGNEYPKDKKNLENDLALLCGKAKRDKLYSLLVENVIKPSWNPNALNAYKFMVSIFDGNKESLEQLTREHTAKNDEMHRLALNFLNLPKLTTSTGVVQDIIEESDLTNESTTAYRAPRSERAYLPAQVYAYIQRNNPKNNNRRNEEWNETLTFARAHARGTDNYGRFCGENTYAAELISCIGDYQAIYSYCFRLLQTHLSKENNERSHESYQLPYEERMLFVNIHKQPTFLAHIDALHEYVYPIVLDNNRDKVFTGNSFKLSQLICEICEKENVAVNISIDERSDDDKAVIQGHMETWKKKAKEIVLQWGMKRFNFLIHAHNYYEFSEEHDNFFYRQFIASHPALKEALLSKAMAWLSIEGDGAYIGHHNKFWKIISWLDDANLINLYAGKRLYYIFDKNTELAPDDADFILQNKNVEGFLSKVCMTLYKYLKGENFAGNHNNYRNLVLWLKDQSVDKNIPALTSYVEQVVNIYIEKRLTYLLNNNVDLTQEDWSFLVKCKSIPGINITAQKIISQYIKERYDGRDIQFIELILGYQQAFPGDAASIGFLYKPYTTIENAGNYIAKRLVSIFTDGDKFIEHESRLINDLFESADEDTVAIKKVVAQQLTDLIMRKVVFWQASIQLTEVAIQSYTSRIMMIVSNRVKERTIEQLTLMHTYAQERLLVLLLANQASPAEMAFFDACCSESLVKDPLSAMVIRNIRKIVVHRSEFNYVRIINQLNNDAIASYYVERFRYLLAQNMIVFPSFDKSVLSGALTQIPTNEALNSGIKILAEDCVNNTAREINSPNKIKDRRVIELLEMLNACKNNEEFVAQQCAHLLNTYLQNNIDPPDFFRDFCINCKNEILPEMLDCVVKCHLQQRRLLIEADDASLAEHVVDITAFNNDKIDWYKTLSNYASDKTYDDVFVSLLTGLIKRSDRKSVLGINAKLADLEAKGNKQRTVFPITERGRQRLDAVIASYVYIDSSSKPWNSAVCQIAHEGRCSPSLQDKYRCGELIRHLSPTLQDRKIFKEFFKISDNANWMTSSVGPRVKFISDDNQPVLQHALTDYLQNHLWNGNAQRVIDNYAQPETATEYHYKWYLEQLASRDEKLRIYASQRDVNYSSNEDATNRKTYETESALLRQYGSNLKQDNNQLSPMLVETIKFLEQMRLDKLDALEIIENHFANSNDNNKYQQQIKPFIDRYKFIMIEILNNWKNNEFVSATSKLLEEVTNCATAKKDATVEGDNEQQIAERKKQAEEHNAWLKTYLERGKYVAEEYIKQLLLCSHLDVNEALKKARAVAESFHNGLIPSHPYKNKGEFLTDIITITTDEVIHLRNTYEAVRSLITSVLNTSTDKLAQKLYAEKTLDGINVEVLTKFTKHMPVHLLETMLKNLEICKTKVDRGGAVERIVVLIENIIKSRGNKNDDKQELTGFIDARSIATCITTSSTLKVESLQRGIEICNKYLLHKTAEHEQFVGLKESNGADRSHDAKRVAHDFKQNIRTSSAFAGKRKPTVKQSLNEDFDKVINRFDAIKDNNLLLNIFITEFNTHPENKMFISASCNQPALVREALINWKNKYLGNITIVESLDASPAASSANLLVTSNSQQNSLDARRI